MLDLFPFQREGVEFLTNGGRALAYEAGLGKSATSLHAAKDLGANTILVQCPAIAVGVWKHEVAKWRPDLTAVDMKDLVKGKVKLPERDRVLITSYDHVVASPKVRGLLSGLRHDLMICDEAHQLRTVTAKRTHLTYGAWCRGGEHSLVGKCGRTIAMSGTFVLNHAGEVFSHLKALAPELVNGLDHDGFVDRYCLREVRTITYRDRNGQKNTTNIDVITGTNRETAPELAVKLRKFWLRRTVEQVMPELPPLRIENRALTVHDLDPKMLAKVEESPEAEEIRNAVMLDLDLQAIEGHVARLRQLMALMKVPATVSWVEDLLDSGEPKVAVWGWHVAALRQVHAALAGHQPIMIIGETTGRDKLVERFMTDPKCRIGVFQIQAAGTALTLVECRRAVMLEQAWTPALNQQAIRRIYRIGQTKPVLVDVLAAPGLDWAVQETLSRKIHDITTLEGE